MNWCKKIVGLLVVVSVAFVLGCATTGGMSSMKPDPQAAACESACAKAKDECEQKCGEDANPDACKVACQTAREKCVGDCKE